MSIEILERLRNLQKARGDPKAFASVDEFLPWSDEVLALLSFDQELEEKFEFWSDHIKSQNHSGRDDHRNALSEAIGIVNQAVMKLELQPPPTEENKILAVAKEIPYPDKITLKWIFDHAPLNLWMKFLGALFTAFVLGAAAAELPYYKIIKANIVSLFN